MGGRKFALANHVDNCRNFGHQTQIVPEVQSHSHLKSAQLAANEWGDEVRLYNLQSLRQMLVSFRKELLDFLGWQHCSLSVEWEVDQQTYIQYQWGGHTTGFKAYKRVVAHASIWWEWIWGLKAKTSLVILDLLGERKKYIYMYTHTKMILDM